MLYLVLTHPATSYRTCTEAAVRAGVEFVQLRMKDASDADVLAVGREIRAITRGTSTHFILNDNPALAVQCGADGVHLGQDDLSIAEARKRFPELRIFGLSTHSMEQMRAAEACENSPPAEGCPKGGVVLPDYIGIGPVFPTPTKPDYQSLGLPTAAAIAKATTLPYVAIGGIDEENLPDVLAAGIRHVAVVRAICASPDPYSAIRRLQEKMLQ